MAANQSRGTVARKVPKFESYLPEVDASIAWPLAFENTPKAIRGSVRSSVNVGTAQKRRALAVPMPLPGPVGGRGADFGRLFNGSRHKALQLARQIVVNSAPAPERIAGTRNLVHWASSAGDSAHRRAITQVFKSAKAQPLLIHHISELPMDQAAVMMKDFFDAGGDEASVAEWLRQAGRRGAAATPPSQPTRKVAAIRGASAAHFAFGWFDDVVDWLGDKIGNIVNAIVRAGHSLASVIGQAVSWTVDQLSDLARALKRAGRGAAEFLAAAASKGAAFVQKVVEAALRVGYLLNDVLAWVARQVLALAKPVVQTLLGLGHTMLSLIRALVGRGADLLRGLLQVLMALGQTVLHILALAAGQVLAVMQAVINALRALGQTVRAILAEAAKLTVSAVKLVLQALFALGITLNVLLAEAAGLVVNALRIVLSALLVIGYGIAQLLGAVANAVDDVVRAVVGSLLGLGRALAELVLAAVQLGLQVCRRVFAALVALGRRVVDILVALAGRTISALRTALEALLSMGVALASIVRDVLMGVVEGFRRGFFEGLIALGKAPLALLRAAALAGAAIALLACTVLLEIFGGHRGLSAAERIEAARIFGTSIDLGRVKVAVASLPADLVNYLNNDRPFTSMYIINFGSGAVVETDVLIHELTHVWQGVQDGPLYMTRALEAQLKAGLSELFHSGEYEYDAAYRVTGEMLTDANGDFSKFNPEQQASIVEFYWKQKFGGGGNVSLPSVDLLEPYAKQVFKGTSALANSRRVAKRVKAPSRTASAKV